MPLIKGDAMKKLGCLVLLLMLLVLTLRVATVHEYSVKSVEFQGANAFLNVYSRNVYRYPFFVFVDNPHVIYVYVSPYQYEENIEINMIEIEIDGHVAEFKDYELVEVRQEEDEQYQIVLTSVNLPKTKFSLKFVANIGSKENQTTNSLKFNIDYKKSVTLGSYLYDHVRGI